LPVMVAASACRLCRVEYLRRKNDCATCCLPTIPEITERNSEIYAVSD
jgi:hypothetical protein